MLSSTQCYEKIIDPLGLKNYPIANYTTKFMDEMSKFKNVLYRGVTDQILCAEANYRNECVSKPKVT